VRSWYLHVVHAEVQPFGYGCLDETLIDVQRSLGHKQILSGNGEQVQRAGDPITAAKVGSRVVQNRYRAVMIAVNALHDDGHPYLLLQSLAQEKRGQPRFPLLVTCSLLVAPIASV
jgi:hypothetical protein